MCIFCTLLSHCLCSELQAEVEELVGADFFQSRDFGASPFAFSWDERELITWSKGLTR